MDKTLNKKGRIDLDKLLIAILVFAVVAVVLVFIFRANVLRSLGILPSFSSFDSEFVSPNEDAIEQCMEIGKIGAPEKESWYKSKEQYIYVNGQKTNLYLDDNKNIKLKRPFFGSDVIVGVITNLGVILIEDNFLNEESSVYKRYKEELPPVNVLKYLLEAYYIPGNILCKKRETLL